MYHSLELFYLLLYIVVYCNLYCASCNGQPIFAFYPITFRNVVMNVTFNRQLADILFAKVAAGLFLFASGKAVFVLAYSENAISGRRGRGNLCQFVGLSNTNHQPRAVQLWLHIIVCGYTANTCCGFCWASRATIAHNANPKLGYGTFDIVATCEMHENRTYHLESSGLLDPVDGRIEAVFHHHTDCDMRLLLGCCD